MKQFVIRMFGESITERMNELGMTKTALIKQAEISQSLVSVMRCVSMIAKVMTFGKPITTTLN